MSQKSSVPQAISFVSQVLKRDTSKMTLRPHRQQSGTSLDLPLRQHIRIRKLTNG